MGWAKKLNECSILLKFNKLLLMGKMMLQYFLFVNINIKWMLLLSNIIADIKIHYFSVI